MSLLSAPTYRWTVEDYEDLGRRGFFRDGERVELLHGEIVVMSPIGSRHARAVLYLNNDLAARAVARFLVNPQNPFNLDSHSQPQPDLALIHPSRRKRHHPEPEEIFLIIEVSDTSVRYDRDDKGAAYAAQEIPEYWLLNLAENQLEVFRRPSGGAWQEKFVLSAEDTIAPLAFPDLQLTIGNYLP